MNEAMQRLSKLMWIVLFNRVRAIMVFKLYFFSKFSICLML